MDKTRTITFAALGIALYVALGFAVQVPVFENYYIFLGYVVMLLYCTAFGPAMGCAVGGIGCVLYCLLSSGLRGMPGWTLGNLAMGLVIGFAFRATARIGRKAARLAAEAIVIAAACAVGILLVKSFIEVVLYAQPMAVRMAKNVFAFVADLVILEASLPVCYALTPMAQRITCGQTADIDH